MSKNDPKSTIFDKYDVEASINEIENTESHSTYKYEFTILSNPKNIRLAIDGTARVIGSTKERDDITIKDKNGVPKILSSIYQELFPTFFLLSKSLNVSCPPYQITIKDAVDYEVKEIENNVEDVSTQDVKEAIVEPQMSQSTV
jgi:uncharacterized membrane protein